MVAATGIGSGLDIESLVTQLVQAERAPAENRLRRQETRLTAEISAFGTLQGALGGLQDAVDTLSRLDTFGRRSATSSDSAAIAVSAGSAAAPGVFRVQVDQLAQSQSLASGTFASPSDAVGEGTLTFRFGTVVATPPADTPPSPQTFDTFSINADRAAATITIDGSNNTLAGVRDAINEADIGVSATIVNDGSGFRLLLNAADTGAANALEIQVGDSDANDTDALGLSRLAFNTGAANLTQTAAGRDAQFSINGLNLTSASNEADDVIDGVVLTLLAETDSAVSVSVSEDVGTVRAAIETFVSAFNGFVSTANSLTAFNPATGEAAPLQGDFTTRTVINQLRAALSTPAEGFDGPFTTLSELGVRTQADGTLSINDAILDAALEANFDSVAGLFARSAVVADANIRFAGVTEDTQVGSFAVNVTQLATRASLSGAPISAPTVAAPLTIDSNNDSFSLAVDGVASGTISLTQGDFTNGEALAAELQARINGDSALAAAGVSVSVMFDAGRLQIRSSRFGSESRVAITAVDSNTAASLGLSVASGTDGVDVAGSIGGVVAVGSGQLLSAAPGSDADGLRLSVTGGALGDRGAVDVSSGVAAALGSILGGFLGGSGLLEARTDGLQGSVDRIADDRDALDRRLEALEARIRLRFNALDTLLANLQSTSNFLTQQLANIPVPGSNNN
ncbi:MAG: flagellar filament capping protein FliD [Halieaceae bacterium]|jgi:flagellar hook-associated protein 2|nr:flagellar filament capping protein FliD [Halieaceae bacterium]